MGVSVYLFPECDAIEGQQCCQSRVSHKGLIVHELVAGEGGESIEIMCCCCFEVSNRQLVGPLVHLETIPTIPVPPFFDESIKKMSLVKISLSNNTFQK